MNNRKRPSSERPQNNRHRRRRRPSGGQQGRPEPVIEQASRSAPPVLKRYAVVFFDTHAQAREQKEQLANLRQDCDQLNIVIRAEGSMEDAELSVYGRLYAGEAWYTIHRRRESEGWYQEPHE